MKYNKVLLRAENICKRYGNGEGAADVLHGLTMEIYEGELLVILGSSGSGKSTLLNLLGGMDQANGGSILFEGKDLCTMNDRELTRYRNESIGFVFQSFNLISELTARENLALICNDKRAVDEALDAVGMLDKKDKYPSQLSGGEQQRVSIARAIVRKPRLLLCDEPTGALDYQTGRQILVQLERSCRKKGMTVVFVTHTREIGRMADRVMQMRSGEIQEERINNKPCSAEEVEW